MFGKDRSMINHYNLSNIFFCMRSKIWAWKGNSIILEIQQQKTLKTSTGWLEDVIRRTDIHWQKGEGRRNRYYSVTVKHLMMATARIPVLIDFIGISKPNPALKYRINWERYTIYAGGAGTLPHINRTYTISFVA